MAERKIFAGAKVRRVRLRLGLSQSQMASAVGLSPSYWNLIERNQRPLTVQVLLKLSTVFDINVRELSSDDGAEAVEVLKEVFSDPLVAGELPGTSEIAELCDVAPNAARAIARLHDAYRETLGRLSDLSQALAAGSMEPPAPAGRLPQDRVGALFESASPWFEPLEREAEALSGHLSPRDDLHAALRAHLRDSLGVDLRIMPLHVMAVERARFDRHTRRLFVSERVPLVDRSFLVARQIALLGHGELLDALTLSAQLDDPEASRICRLEFARRFAEAVLMPATRLREAARDLRCDVVRLADRFAARPSRVMARLAALGAAPSEPLPAAFLVSVDPAGAILARQAAAGYAFPRHGALCARLPLFDPLPGGRAAQALIDMPGLGEFAVIAVHEEDSALPDWLPPPRRLTMIGWRRDEAPGVAAGPPGAQPRPVGLTCRLCERLDCGHRAQPAASRPGAFQDHVVGPSDHGSA